MNGREICTLPAPEEPLPLHAPKPSKVAAPRPSEA
jgi:hypothetical protein